MSIPTPTIVMTFNEETAEPTLDLMNGNADIEKIDGQIVIRSATNVDVVVQNLAITPDQPLGLSALKNTNHFVIVLDNRPVPPPPPPPGGFVLAF